MTDKQGKSSLLKKKVSFGGSEVTLYSIDGTTWSSRADELQEIIDRHKFEQAGFSSDLKGEEREKFKTPFNRNKRFLKNKGKGGPIPPTLPDMTPMPTIKELSGEKPSAIGMSDKALGKAPVGKGASDKKEVKGKKLPEPKKVKETPVKAAKQKPAPAPKKVEKKSPAKPAKPAKAKAVVSKKAPPKAKTAAKVKAKAPAPKPKAKAKAPAAKPLKKKKK